MSKPMKLPFMKCWRERIWTPQYTYLSEGLPVDYIFTGYRPKYPLYVAAPMKSGKIGLFRLLEIYTPLDPGDMHIPRWGFIKYVKERI